MEQWVVYLLSGLSVALVVAIMVIIVLASVLRKIKNSAYYADKVVKKHGMRYSKEEKIMDKNGNTLVTHLPKDVILEGGKVYHVAKHGKVIPGQYTVLAAEQGNDTFTIKIGDVVKTYKHNDHIVLVEGTTVSARSGSVILR